MTYKEELIKAMEMLAEDKNTIFLGYNVKYGPQMNKTLTTVPQEQLLEMPVAENLIMGVAMGLSLTGYRPVVCFERMDFMLSCMDAIVNHLSKLPVIANDQFDCRVIIRACIGHNEPLDPGIQHTGDYLPIFQSILRFPVIRLFHADTIANWYKVAFESTTPIMLVESKKFYEGSGNGHRS